MPQKKDGLKIYPFSLTLSTVAANAVPPLPSVQKVLKITDGDFRWRRLAVYGTDANGANVEPLNITLKVKQGSRNLFADEVHVATLQRLSNNQFHLEPAEDLQSLSEINFVVTPQPGSTATTVYFSLIGNDIDMSAESSPTKPASKTK